VLADGDRAEKKRASLGNRSEDVHGGYTFFYPIGAYSEKYDSIEALPDGATIALPNDPSNEGRALILMHNEGLITLEDTEFLVDTPLEIAENPHDFDFRENETAPRGA